MKAIINATLVMPDHYIPVATLLIENDRIIDFGKKLAVPENAEIIDAQGNFVGPGLIDIHTHADGDTYFHDDPVKCSRTLLDHGVTSVLPALFYSMNKQEHLDAIKGYKDAIAAGECGNIIGVYMEGPYYTLSPQLNAPDKEDSGLYQRRTCSSIRMLGKGWLLKPTPFHFKSMYQYFFPFGHTLIQIPQTAPLPIC